MGSSQVAQVVKNPPANAGDTREVGSTPGLGRSPGVGTGNPFQYSRLENSMDRGAWGLQSMGSQTWWSCFHVQNTSLLICTRLWFQPLIPSFSICYHQKEPSIFSEVQKRALLYEMQAIGEKDLGRLQFSSERSGMKLTLTEALPQARCHFIKHFRKVSHPSFTLTQ